MPYNANLKFAKIPWHLIVIFLLLSLGIGTSGYFYYKNQKDYMKNRVEEELSAIADLKVGQILNWRRERIGNANTIFRSPFLISGIHQYLKNPSDSRLRQRVLNWMMFFRQNYGYESMLLLNTQRTVLLSVPKGKALDTYIQHQVEEALRTNKMIMTDLYKTEATGHIHLGIVIPILPLEGGRSRPISVILLQVDPYQFLYPLVQSWPIFSRTAETLLSQKEGNEVVFLNELRHRKGTALNLRFPISEAQLPAAMAARGQEGIVEGLDYRGVPVLAATRRIPGSPWSLIAKVDKEEVYEVIHWRATTVAILAGILIVGAGVILGLFWSKQRAQFYRKQYETEIKHQALVKRFDYLTKYANDIILLIDQDLKILEANDRALSSYGYTREELLQLNLGELRPPDLRLALNEQIEQIVESNGLVYETLNQRKDGTIFPVEVSSRLIEVEGKKFFQSIIRDISERKHSENVLRDSQAELSAIVENIPAILLIVDRDRRVREVNGMATKFARRPADEMRGLRGGEALRCLHSLDDPRGCGFGLSCENCTVRNALLETFNTGRSQHRMEAKLPFDLDEKVEETHFLLSTIPLTISKEEMVLVCIEDITELKRAEEALRSEKAWSEVIVSSAPNIIIGLGEGSNILIFNKSIERLTGYKAEEVMGKPWVETFIPQGIRGELYTVWDEIVKNKLIEHHYENPIVTKQGDERIISWNNTVLTSDDKFRMVLSVGEDITERKRAEEEKAALQEQLRQSQKMEAIGRLAGGIAHDFNNLLTIIKGYSQLSLLELRENDPLRQGIEQIGKATDRATDLTHQILAFSRRQILEMKILDLNTVLGNLDRMLHRILGEDIELVTFLADDLGRVKTDLGWIEQVIMNLSVNARDAMPHGGKLTIETANVELDEAYARSHVAVTPGRYVMLSVSDTGVGMTPEIMAQVFEPFFTTKEKGKGTGLGLSTVYGIVKQSGGNIWVYSEPGKGATFKIYLPRVDEPLGEERKRVERGEIPRGDETILVVEDEAEVRKVAVRMLRGQGYKVLEAEEGVDASRICGEH
jgi:PAS domain S-box-containing protein